MFTNYLQGVSFLSKVKIRGMSSRHLEYIAEQSVYSFYMCMKNSCFTFSFFSVLLIESFAKVSYTHEIIGFMQTLVLSGCSGMHL